MSNKKLEGFDFKDLSDRELDKLKQRFEEEYTLRRKNAKRKYSFFNDLWGIFLDIKAEDGDKEDKLLSSSVYKMVQDLGYICDITLGNYEFVPAAKYGGDIALKRSCREVPLKLCDDYKAMADELIKLIDKYHSKPR